MLKEILISAKRLPITLDKDMSEEYINTLYEAVDKEYLIETSVGYRITETGRNYLTERLPTNIPQIKAATKHTIRYHIGTYIVKIFNNDWFKLIITAILGILIGTWLLIKFHMVK